MWFAFETVPPAIRQHPLQSLDPLFSRSLKTSATVGLVLMIGLYFVPSRPTVYSSLEEVPDRLARLIVEPHEPEPASATAAPQTSAEAPAAPAIDQAVETPPPVATRTRVRDVASARPAPPAGGGGERGRQRAAQVTSAIEAGGMLSAVDGMLRGLRAVSAADGESPRGTRDAAGSAALARAQALAAASAAERGAGEVAGAAEAAGGQIGGAALAHAAVEVEELAPVAAGASGQAPPVERSPESLMAVVHRYAGGIKYCYDQSLRARPELRGRLVLLLTVAPSGAVSRVRVVGDTLKHSELKDCVLGQVRAWKFPPSSGQPISFRCPLVFTPPVE